MRTVRNLAVLASASLMACGGGGAAIPPPAPPAVEVLSPEHDTVSTLTTAGTAVAITYRDEAPPGAPAATSLFADRDGDLTTAHDRIEIAADRPAGGLQSVSWNTSGAPPGSYEILAALRTDDSTLLARAPGRVNVVETFIAPDDDTASYYARGLAAAPDGATYVLVVTDVSRALVYGRGQPNETTLRGAPYNGGAPIYRQTHYEQPNPFPNQQLARYAPDGTLAWAVEFGGFAYESNRAVYTGSPFWRSAAALPDSSVVVTGAFVRHARFGVFDLMSAAADYSTDIFVARLAADGTVLWARREGGAGADAGIAVAAFPGGDIAVAGTYSGPAVFGGGEPNETVLGGTRGIFVARYGPDGSLRFAHEFAAQGDYGPVHLNVAAADTDDIFVGGDVTTVSGATPSSFHVLARYDSLGARAWRLESPSGNSTSGPFEQLAAQPDGSVLAAGRFHGHVEVGGASLDRPGRLYVPVISRIARDGRVESLVTPSVDTLAWFEVLLGGDDSYFVVTGGQPVTLDAGTADEARFGRLDYGLLLARYSADGTRRWARQDEFFIGAVRGARVYPDASLVLYSSAAPLRLDGRLIGFPGEAAVLARYGGDGEFPGVLR